MRSDVVHIFRLSVKRSGNLPGSLRFNNMRTWTLNGTRLSQSSTDSALQDRTHLVGSEETNKIFYHVFSHRMQPKWLCVLCCVFSTLLSVYWVCASCITHPLSVKVTPEAVIFIHLHCFAVTVETYNLALSLWCCVVMLTQLANIHEQTALWSAANGLE